MTHSTQAGATARSLGSVKADLKPNTEITLNVTPPMFAMLEQMVRDSHQPLEVVFTKALALYRAALNAQAEGKHIGYAELPEGLEVEFTGITGSGGVS